MVLLPCFLHHKLLAQVPQAPGPASSILHFLIRFKLPSFNLFLLQSISSKSLLSVLLSISECHPPVLQHTASLPFLPNNVIPSQYQNHCSACLISLLNWSLGHPATGFLTQGGSASFPKYCLAKPLQFL